jgi:hypothetical protein
MNPKNKLMNSIFLNKKVIFFQNFISILLKINKKYSVNKIMMYYI